MAMEYSKTPPTHNFDGIKTKVNHGYDITKDVVGYMIRITDTNMNTPRSYTIRLRTDVKGRILEVLADD